MFAQTIKILLADDTLIAREGWKRILETENDMEVVGEAGVAQEVPMKLKDLSVDVLLMDLMWSYDESAGWVTIREAKRDYPKVKIIAVTAYDNLIPEARRAGADAALLKTFSREDLINLIRALASRQENTLDLESIKTFQERLTKREMEVLKLLGEGLQDKEIAVRLNIAPTTAKNHVKSILEKLDARNRTHAVSIARKIGLIR